MPASEERGKLEAELAEARAALVERPDDRERLIWVGRRLGYLWGYREAVDIFSRGIERFPEHAAFYRHRGHRWISLREFDKAIVDLEKAAELIRGKPDQIEPDGRPNGENKPLTTLGFNVSYHLPLAHYLKGDFERSLPAWRESMNHLGGHDDNLVAVTDWLYMTLRRLGRDEEAARLLEPIKPEMHIIANHAYHRRCLMYKGLPEPAQVLDVSQASDLDLATLGYGMGNWHFYIGRRDEAVKVWKRVVAGPHWPAFGFVAAEAELARLKER